MTVMVAIFMPCQILIAIFACLHIKYLRTRLKLHNRESGCVNSEYVLLNVWRRLLRLLSFS